MYMLLYDYKQLSECTSEIERIEAGVNSKKNEWLTRNEGEGGGEKEERTARKGRSAHYLGYLFYQE
jgi:hypothetical protein